MEHACSQCGKNFYRDRRNHEKGGAPLCSIGCKALYQTVGICNIIYKRGGYGSYLMLKFPSHPFCNNAGYVPVHRIVMENVLDRFLEPGEVVHHIDMDIENNKRENLWLFADSSAHHIAHGSINDCAKELLEKGLIGFDREKEKYYVISNEEEQ